MKLKEYSSRLPRRGPTFKINNKFLFTIFHIIVMSIDLLLIAAILYISSITIWLGIILGICAHSVQTETGGWFFAWKKKNRINFEKNFQKFFKSK